MPRAVRKDEGGREAKDARAKDSKGTPAHKASRPVEWAEYESVSKNKCDPD